MLPVDEQADRQTDITKIVELDFLRNARTIPFTVSCYLRGEEVGKDKGLGDAGYDASTCFMARGVTEILLTYSMEQSPS